MSPILYVGNITSSGGTQNEPCSGMRSLEVIMDCSWFTCDRCPLSSTFRLRNTGKERLEYWGDEPINDLTSNFIEVWNEEVDKC